MTEDTREVHEHILSLLGAADAASIMDLGCGRGHHLRMLAEGMPEDVRLVGLDFREEVLNEARAAVQGDPRFTFLQHDLTEPLPFEDGEFDRVLSVDVLEAIPAKGRFAREAHRVLKPGGRLVCAHHDWESQLYDGANKSLVRRIVQASANWKLSWMTTNDSWMGRRLWSAFQEEGLFAGKVNAYTHTSTNYAPGCHGWEWSRHFEGLIERELITRAEYDEFVDGLEQLADEDRYFYAITMFSYVGVKVSSNERDHGE